MDAMAPTMLLDNRNPLLFKLRDYKVNQMASTTIKEITDKGVVVEKDGKEITLEADTVINALGMKANSEVRESIFDKYAPITAPIGDCKKVGQIGEAVREGFFAAYAIH